MFFGELRAHDRRQEPAHAAGPVSRRARRGCRARAGARRAASTSIRGSVGVDGRSPASPSSTRSRARRASSRASSSPARPRTTPDKQGRVLVPADARAARGAREGRRRRRASTTTSRSGTAPAWEEHLKAVEGSVDDVAERLAENAQLTTSPSSRTRCASSSPCARARPSSTPRSAPAATPGCSPRTSGGAASSSRSTATRRAKSLLRPLQGRRRRRRPLPPRRLRARPGAARRERRQGRRDPARPRRLVDADRPARARLLVRDRRAARHAHGPHLRARPRPTIVNTWDERELATSSAATARSGTPRRSPARSCAAAHERAVRAHGRARRHDQARDPDAGAVRRGAPGQARLPGAAHRGQRRARRARGGAARRRSRCCGRAAGSP